MHVKVALIRDGVAKRGRAEHSQLSLIRGSERLALVHEALQRLSLLFAKVIHEDTRFRRRLPVDLLNGHITIT